MTIMRCAATLIPFLIVVLLQYGARDGARADDPLARQVNGHSFDQFVQLTLQYYSVPGAVVAVSSAERRIFLSRRSRNQTG
jgi:hypothetical protein